MLKNNLVYGTVQQSRPNSGMTNNSVIFQTTTQQKPIESRPGSEMGMGKIK